MSDMATLLKILQQGSTMPQLQNTYNPSMQMSPGLTPAPGGTPQTPPAGPQSGGIMSMLGQAAMPNTMASIGKMAAKGGAGG